MERTRGRGERGVALLIVLVVLFIVAVLMLDITLTATTARRAARNASSDFLMDAAIEANLQVALAQLRYDYNPGKKVDSPDDRWAREEYTRFEKTQSEEERAAEAQREEETGAVSLGDSDAVDVVVTIEDEERKFNLNLLKQADAKKAEAARKCFVALLDRYREDTPLDLSRTRAEEICDAIVRHLDRAQPGENDPNSVPVPPSKTWILLTPDELRMIPALKDDSRGLGPEGILYDARDPEAVRTYMLDPESQEPPEEYPGLLRYVTLWSGGAWPSGAAQAPPAQQPGGQPGSSPQPQPPAAGADNWKRINLNTAEKPVLEMLFHANPADMTIAERIISYRGTSKEGSPAEGETAELDEPLAEHQYFTNLEEVKKGVPELTQAILDAHKLAEYARFDSETFSIKVVAKHEGATKQVRFVVRRGEKGFETLLREERADPSFEEEPEEGEEETR
jgi:hypothetical protein